MYILTIYTMFRYVDEMYYAYKKQKAIFFLLYKNPGNNVYVQLYVV